MDLPKEHDMVRCVREGLEGPSKAKANITYEECSGKHLGLECKWFCHVLSCFLGLEENSQCRNQMFTCRGDAIDHPRGPNGDLFKLYGSKTEEHIFAYNIYIHTYI